MIEIAFNQFQRDHTRYVADVSYDFMSERPKTDESIVLVRTNRRGEEERAVLHTVDHIEPYVSVFTARRYRNNPEALSRAFQQMFDLAVDGRVAQIKTRDYMGRSISAYIMPYTA